MNEDGVIRSLAKPVRLAFRLIFCVFSDERRRRSVHMLFAFLGGVRGILDRGDLGAS